MSDLPEPSFLAELQRRRVFRVLVGYGVVAFAVLQVVEPIQHALGLSDAVLKIVVVLLGLGFPVAVVLGWAFDVNAGGLANNCSLKCNPLLRSLHGDPRFAALLKKMNLPLD